MRSVRTSRPLAAGHGVDHVAGLVGHGLHHRPGQVRPARAPGDAHERAPGVGVPPGAAQPGERRHQVDAAGVGHRLGQRPDLGRLADQPQAVPQPLHGGAGHEDGALQRVGRWSRRPASSPRVVSSPSTGSGQVGPTFISTNEPVP